MENWDILLWSTVISKILPYSNSPFISFNIFKMSQVEETVK